MSTTMFANTSASNFNVETVPQVVATGGSLGRVFRSVVAFVPRRATPLPVNGPVWQPVFRSGHFEDLTRKIPLAVAAIIFSAAFVAMVMLLVTLFVAGNEITTFTNVLLTIFTVGIFATMALLMTDLLPPDNKLLFHMAVRLTVAREGAFAAPATWLFGPVLWEAVFGSIIEQLPEDELEIVAALAGEWKGTFGELLSTASLLVKRPKS